MKPQRPLFIFTLLVVTAPLLLGAPLSTRADERDASREPIAALGDGVQSILSIVDMERVSLLWREFVHATHTSPVAEITRQPDTQAEPSDSDTIPQHLPSLREPLEPLELLDIVQPIAPSHPSSQCDDCSVLLELDEEDSIDVNLHALIAHLPSAPTPTRALNIPGRASSTLSSSSSSSSKSRNHHQKRRTRCPSLYEQDVFSDLEDGSLADCESRPAWAELFDDDKRPLPTALLIEMSRSASKAKKNKKRPAI